MYSNVTVTVLAGGTGSRLGDIGKVIPKSLMPIYGSTLIEENLRFATSHFEKVFLSTRPEFIAIFMKYLDIICTKYDWAKRIELISNPRHKESSLDALSFLEKVVKTDYVLSMFSDIYFFSDPFVNFPEKIGDNLLGLTLVTRNRNQKVGLAKVNQGKVTSLKYTFIDDRKNNLEWNGITLMSTTCWSYLKKFLQNIDKPVPEEKFINRLINDKKKFKYYFCPRFVNANTNEDFWEISKIRRSSSHKFNH